MNDILCDFFKLQVYARYGWEDLEDDLFCPLEEVKRRLEDYRLEDYRYDDEEKCKYRILHCTEKVVWED